jgi:hypothetical protein
MGLIIGGVSPQDLILDGQSVSLYVGGSPPVKIWPTTEVHEVTLTDVLGFNTVHPLLIVTVPAGETWQVRIQGTMTKAGGVSSIQPLFRIGVTDSGTYAQGAAVDFSGTVTAASSTIALVSNDAFTGSSFTGTVTIEK